MNASAATTPRRARPLSILVVDDDRDTVATLAAVLADEGHIVHTVNQALLVMEAVRRFQPEVCILDIEMPGKSGYGVAREIVEEFGKRRPLLIAISGKWKSQTDRMLAEVVGFDRFLTKPADPAALLALLQELAPSPGKAA